MDTTPGSRRRPAGPDLILRKPSAAASTIEWVDIAGLAKGASRGEGLGNQFLGTARDCDALCLNLTLTLTTEPEPDY